MDKNKVEFSIKEGLETDIYRASLTVETEQPVEKQDMMDIRFREQLEKRVQRQMLNNLYREVYIDQWKLQADMAKLAKAHFHKMKQMSIGGNKTAAVTLEFLEEFSVLLGELRQSTLP